MNKVGWNSMFAILTSLTPFSFADLRFIGVCHLGALKTH